MKENKRNLSVYKIIISAASLCAIMAVMLWLYATKAQDIFSAIEEKGKMDNLLWLVKHITYILPVIVDAAVLWGIYSASKWDVPVYSKKEQGLAVLLTAAFTYIIMLPCVIFMSPAKETVEQTAEQIPTLIEITRGWFFIQLVPFILWALYLFVRCESEKRELSEESEEQ